MSTTLKIPPRTIAFVAAALLAFGAAAFFVSSGTSTERFDSASQVVEALKAEGVECYDFRTLNAPQESIKDFGLCFLSEGHDFESDIYVFEDATNRDLWADGFEGKIGMLVGENWFITNGDESELNRLQETLGGEIR